MDSRNRRKTTNVSEKKEIEQRYRDGGRESALLRWRFIFPKKKQLSKLWQMSPWQGKWQAAISALLVTSFTRVKLLFPLHTVCLWVLGLFRRQKRARALEFNRRSERQSFLQGRGFLLFCDIWSHYQNKLDQFKPPAGKSGVSVFPTAKLQIWEQELGLPTTRHSNRFAILVLQIHMATNVISD